MCASQQASTGADSSAAGVAGVRRSRPPSHAPAGGRLPRLLPLPPLLLAMLAADSEGRRKLAPPAPPSSERRSVEGEGASVAAV